MFIASSLKGVIFTPPSGGKVGKITGVKRGESPLFSAENRGQREKHWNCNNNCLKSQKITHYLICKIKSPVGESKATIGYLQQPVLEMLSNDRTVRRKTSDAELFFQPQAADTFG